MTWMFLLPFGCEENTQKVTAMDNDGDGWSVEDGDCDDNAKAVFPNSIEICDGIDNDCDGLVDDADDYVSPTTTKAFYADVGLYRVLQRVTQRCIGLHRAL